MATRPLKRTIGRVTHAVATVSSSDDSSALVVHSQAGSSLMVTPPPSVLPPSTLKMPRLVVERILLSLHSSCRRRDGGIATRNSRAHSGIPQVGAWGPSRPCGFLSLPFAFIEVGGLHTVLRREPMSFDLNLWQWATLWLHGGPLSLCGPFFVGSADGRTDGEGVILASGQAVVPLGARRSSPVTPKGDDLPLHRGLVPTSARPCFPPPQGLGHF